MRILSIPPLLAVWGLPLLALAFPAAADDINVPGDHFSIQAAINAAGNGDRIIVAGGLFFEFLTVSGKEISLVRQVPSNDVTINAFGGNPALSVTNGAVVRVEGFNLFGGDGAGASPSGDGQHGGSGIVVNSSIVTLVSCTLVGGDGGNGSTQFTSIGGDGGHGALLQAGALVCGDDVSAVGGARGLMGNADGQILVRAANGAYGFHPATLAANIIGTGSLSQLETLTADANGDGGTDAADVVQMVNLCGVYLAP